MPIPYEKRLEEMKRDLGEFILPRKVKEEGRLVTRLCSPELKLLAQAILLLMEAREGEKETVTPHKCHTDSPSSRFPAWGYDKDVMWSKIETVPNDQLKELEEWIANEGLFAEMRNKGTRRTSKIYQENELIVVLCKNVLAKIKELRENK